MRESEKQMEPKSEAARRVVRPTIQRLQNLLLWLVFCFAELCASYLPILAIIRSSSRDFFTLRMLCLKKGWGSCSLLVGFNTGLTGLCEKLADSYLLPSGEG